MKKTFTGIVIEGSKKASLLGFPTANIEIDEPLSGIYAGTISFDDTLHHTAIFGDAKRKLLEAYVLDFSGNLYGKEATFILLEKIRDHGEFTDDASLKTQIAADVANVRTYFRQAS